MYEVLKMTTKQKKYSNIVFLTIDCLRYDITHSLIKKNLLPNIKKLAEKGAFFTQAISTAPWTPPSTISFLTSTYPLMYDGYLNFSPRKSFVKLLRKIGFSTISYQTNAWISRFFGFHKDFSLFMDEFDREKTTHKSIRVGSKFTKMKNFFKENFKLYTWLKKYLIDILRVYSGKFPVHYLPANGITKANLELIKRNSKRPFFAWIHYMDAHEPYVPYNPNLLIAFKYRQIQSKLWKDEQLSADEIKWVFSWYKDSIIYADLAIGSLLSKLEEMNVTFENTYFILTSDHGQEFFEHGIFGHGLHLYEELVHVPLIITGPEIKPCTISQQVSLIDLPVTILGLLGLQEDIPESYLGRDLSSSLKESKPRIAEYPVISEEGVKKRRSAVDEKSRIIRLDLKYRKIAYRFNNWKYIYNERDTDELYNLKKDPKETKNLIETEKELAKEFLKRIRQHIKMEEQTKFMQKVFLKMSKLKK